MEFPKILIICSLAKSLLNFRGDLIAFLRANNFAVYCAAPGFDKKTRLVLEDMGAECEEYELTNTGLNPIADLKSMLQLSAIIKKHHVDLVFPYTIKPVIYGSLAAQRHKVPVVSLITGLGFTFSGVTGKARFLQNITSRLYRYALKSNAGILFQNSDDQQLFLQTKIIPDLNNSMVVHGSGINLNRFPYKERIKKAGEPVKFLIVGRLIREKGAQLFMDAAKRLKRKAPKAEFHVLGGTSKKYATSVSMEEVKELHAAGIIVYHGYLPEVQEVLEQADVFVLPSYYREGVPRSILEAMSSGMPVITTDTPGCRETVQPSVNGFLVEARALDPLVEAMEYFIDNPGQIHIMGRKSRALARDKFEVGKINAQIINQINRCL